MATGCWYKEHLFYRFPLDSVTSSQVYGYDSQPTRCKTEKSKPSSTWNTYVNWTITCSVWVIYQWLDDLSKYSIYRLFLLHCEFTIPRITLTWINCANFVVEEFLFNWNLEHVSVVFNPSDKIQPNQLTIENKTNKTKDFNATKTETFQTNKKPTRNE